MNDANTADPTEAQGHSDRRVRFRAVYDANYHRVLGYALRRTTSRQDAEDVVAETFLTAWRRLELLPPGGNARPWLYGVARNVLANQRRGERRQRRLEGRLTAEPVVSSPNPADVRPELAGAAAAFAELGDDDREILALAAWEGLEPREIATVLRCSRNAARIRLYRARRRLARELQRHDVDAVDSNPAAGGSTRSLVSVETEGGQ